MMKRWGSAMLASVIAMGSLLLQADADSTFMVTDARQLQKWLLCDTNAQIADWTAADINQDGRLNAVDLTLMKRALIASQATEPPVKAVHPSLPSVGTDRIPVFAVSFPDCAFSEEDISERLQDNFFAPANPDAPSYPKESVSAYYARSSYGKLQLTGDVFSYTAQHPIDWYANDDARSLVKEIVSAYDAQIDYQVYDANEDHTIDAIVIVLPDTAIEIDNDADGKPDWWPFSTTVTGNQRYDDRKIGEYCVLAYNRNDCSDFIAKTAHELGHAMGLPDYYLYRDDETAETEGMTGAAGNELMDEGRGDLSACSKLLLGWLPKDQVQVYTGGTQTFTIHSIQAAPSCILIPRNPAGGCLSEYFLIEYTTNEANNQPSGGNGIRIFHVNAELSEGISGTEFKYSIYGQHYDKSNQKQRILRLVNQYGIFYPGTKGVLYVNQIDGTADDFHWYDKNGDLTAETGVKIEIGRPQPGPDYVLDPDPSSSTNLYGNPNDPLFVAGSTYQITVSETA